MNEFLEHMNQKLIKFPFFTNRFFWNMITLIISAVDICLFISLELNEWDGLMKEKIMLNVLTCFKQCHYTLTWKIIKALHVQIFWM